MEKVARGLSAGRVQSVAVKLLVEREREIKAFQSEEFWTILANTQINRKKLPLELTTYKGKKFSASNEAGSKCCSACFGAERFYCF